VLDCAGVRFPGRLEVVSAITRWAVALVARGATGVAEDAPHDERRRAVRALVCLYRGARGLEATVAASTVTSNAAIHSWCSWHCSSMNGTAPPRIFELSLGLVLVGCSYAAPGDSATGASTGDETTFVAEVTTDVDPTSATTTQPEPTGASGDSGSTGEPPPGAPECDVWTQDCADGEKCVPWADDGGTIWNATRCVPVMGNGQPGDSCTLQGEITGIDDCALGSICMRLDNGTDKGICVAQCEGQPEAPSCAELGDACVITNDGVLAICMANCDPVVQDCASGLGCYPLGSNGAPVCWPDFSGEGGAYGDPCATGNGCDPGLFCAGQFVVPGCEHEACCSEFCDLTVADPDAQCSGQAQGQICQSFFFEETPTPGLEHLGVCAPPF